MLIGCLVPSSAVVMVVTILVDEAAVAVKAHGTALFAHVDLEFAGGTATLPAVVAIAHPVHRFADGEGDASTGGQAHVENSRERATQLREGIHPLFAKSLRERDEYVDDGEILGLDPDDEKELELKVAMEHSDGGNQSKNTTQAAAE